MAQDDRPARDKRRDYVYEMLRRDLRAARYAPGDRLIEDAIARDLGVSRTPVREALFQLAKEGLLEAKGRGYVTPTLTPADILELYEMRLLLEPQIARIAAARMEYDDLARLAAALEAERAAAANGDLGAFVDANLEFRQALTAVCPNRRLVAAARLLEDQLRIVMVLTLRPAENRQITLDQHARLLQAIKRRDADRAASASREVIYKAIDEYLRSFGEAPDRDAA